MWVSKCAKLLCNFMSLNMAKGLKLREDPSNSLAEPFLLITMYFVQDSSEVQVVILRCHTLYNNFLKVSCQLKSLFHFCHPGKKRLRKHSCQSASLMFGSVASNNKKRGRALLRISIQFCLGTVVRTLRCRREGSYVPLWRLRRMGVLHGFSERSEAMLCRRRDKEETITREARSNSSRIAVISSTGSDSRVIGMAVAEEMRFTIFVS